MKVKTTKKEILGRRVGGMGRMKVQLVIDAEDGHHIQFVNLAELDKDDYLIVEDKFGRKFKLEPVTNENIKFPFVITPLSEK